MFKRFLFLLVAVFFFQSFHFSAPISFRPIQLKQPNGKILNIFQSGDEFYNWMHDKDDYTIVNDPSTGYYVYAVINNDKLTPSNYIVGETDPSKVHLEKGINIFPQVKPNKNKFQKLSKTSTISSAIGTYYQLMVFVRLKDGSFNQDAVFYDSIYNTGTSSIGQYFKEVSYGQLEVDSKIYARNGNLLLYYDDPHTTNYYRPYNAFLNTEGYMPDERWIRERALFDSAMNYIKKFIPADAQFDGNNDGIIDNINLIIANDNGPWQGIMWPHMSSNDSFTINGVKSDVYNIVFKDAFEDRGGVICESIHEMLHSFGLPDLYRCTDNSQRPVGAYDIMANGFGHMLMYCKYKLGWISDIPVISQSGRYTLKSNMFKDGSIYRINSPRSPKEYYIVELRVKGDRYDFEYQIPGTGMIVYRINENIDFINDWGNFYGPPDHIYIYRPDGNLLNNGSMSKAGFTDLEGRTQINDHSNPSGFLSDGLAGGLDISNIKIENGTASFDVNIKDNAEITLNKDYITGEKSYSWIDISNTGTEITNWINGPDHGDAAKDDGYSASAIPLGFPFYFYGQTFDSVYAGINGLVSFTHQHLSANSRTYGGELKDAGTYIESISWPGSKKFPNSIALAYNDYIIKGTGNGRILYQTIAQKFVLSYENVGLKGGIPGEGCSFQLVLDAADSTITLNYKNFSSVETALSSKVGIAANAIKAIGYYDPVLFNNTTIGNGTSVFFKPDPIFASANYKVQTVNYEWTDISATGREITRWQNGQWVYDQPISHQFSADKIPIGFDFSFYGQKYNSIYVGMDGIISFTHQYLNHTYPEMDIDGSKVGSMQYGLFNFPNSIGIAYNGFSLFRGNNFGGGKIIYQTIEKKFILTYLYVGSTAQMAHDTMNVFQMVLNGNDNTIHLNYQIIGTSGTRTKMTVGLRKDDFSEIIYVNQAVPLENLIADRTSLLFTPGEFPPTASFDELAAAYVNEFLTFPVASKSLTTAATDEFIEVVASQNIPNLQEYRITVYNSSGEEVINTTLDEFTAGASADSFTVYSYTFEGNVLPDQHGALGLAFSGSPIPGSFVSWGGSVTAVNGDWAGLTSTDLGIIPIAGHSYALAGTGTDYDDFHWVSNSGPSPGMVNTSQTIPVELTSFVASAEQNSVLLKWMTATETNNKGFEIEKLHDLTTSAGENQIAGNKDWKKIGFVIGAGTTSEMREYSFVDKNVSPGKYSYRLKQIDLDGSFKYSDIVEVECMPLRYELAQNYPNPFNPITNIKYTLKAQGFVSLIVYDVLGSKVMTLVNEEQPAGTYKVVLDASSLASGVYYYKIISGDFVATKKLLLLK